MGLTGTEIHPVRGDGWAVAHWGRRGSCICSLNKMFIKHLLYAMKRGVWQGRGVLLDWVIPRHPQSSFPHDLAPKYIPVQISVQDAHGPIHSSASSALGSLLRPVYEPCQEPFPRKLPDIHILLPHQLKPSLAFRWHPKALTPEYNWHPVFVPSTRTHVLTDTAMDSLTSPVREVGATGSKLRPAEFQ